MANGNPVLLVIDDDTTFCHLIKKFGESENFSVIAYSSLENIYHDLQSINFDVAVIDYNLGRVNGAQLSNYMKSINQNQPIILISSGSIEGPVPCSDRVVGKVSKMDGLSKVPITAHEALGRAHA